MELPFQQETVYYIGLSLGFFIALQVLSGFVFKYIILTGMYNKLKPAEQSDWNSRIVSTIHAVVATALALYCFTEYPKLWSDVLFYNEKLTRQTLCFTVGYLIADIRYLFDPFDLYMFLHHVTGAYGLYVSSATGLGHFVTLAFVFTEISTPFVNGRVFLTHLGFRDSILFVLNGILITLFFGVVRVAFIVFFYLKIWKQFDQLALYPAVCLVSIALGPNLIHMLNVIWFYKILKGILSILTGSSKADKQKQPKSQ
jgi:hypothetical protein